MIRALWARLMLWRARRQFGDYVDRESDMIVSIEARHRHRSEHGAQLESAHRRQLAQLEADRKSPRLPISHWEV